MPNLIKLDRSLIETAIRGSKQPDDARRLWLSIEQHLQSLQVATVPPQPSPNASESGSSSKGTTSQPPSPVLVQQVTFSGIQRLSENPVNPAIGQVWYDTTTNQIKLWDGSAIQVVAELSNTLDQFGAPLSDLSIGGKKLIDLADPSVSSDAATKNYVDGKTGFVAGVTIDGAGKPPSTGSKGYLQIPFNATITGWTILADRSGSAQITVKKCSYVSFPATVSIVAGAPPSISSAQGNTSTNLAGWVTTIAAGDILEFNLDSVSTCNRITLELQLVRS